MRCDVVNIREARSQPAQSDTLRRTLANISRLSSLSRGGAPRSNTRHDMQNAIIEYTEYLVCCVCMLAEWYFHDVNF